MHKITSGKKSLVPCELNITSDTLKGLKYFNRGYNTFKTRGCNYTK